MNDLKKINKVFFDGNDNIVIQDIENANITINKNNKKELDGFFSNFSGRLAEFETVLIENQNRYISLYHQLNSYMQDNRTVYVVGTGTIELTQQVLKCSQIVGRILAEQNYKLIVGGWHGVDYVVADEFAKVLDKKNIALSSKLSQIVPRSKQPVFCGGDIIEAKEGVMEWIECLKKSNAIIMIGGLGGTYETFIHAKREKKTVIPIAFTGGDAQKVFYEIMDNNAQFPILEQNLDLFKQFEFESNSFEEILVLLLERIFK